MATEITSKVFHWAIKYLSLVTSAEITFFASSSRSSICVTQLDCVTRADGQGAVRRGWDCFPKVYRAINLFEKEDYVKKEDVLIAEGADFKNAMGAFDYTRPKVAYKATTKWNVDETIMKR